MELDKSLESALKMLITKLNPTVVYIFGSAARDEMRDDSDIDIAYVSDVTISSYDNFILAQELADVFKRDVDLINLDEASTVFKAQIIGSGKKVYCTDENQRMYLEMRILKEYALLNEEREPIIKSIKERGSVYGK